MERRFAVHAGADVQALIGRRAGRAWMVALAVVTVAGAATPADARPKRRAAKAEFNRGLAAYKEGDFEAASAALGKSFELERDVDTLFAWAQAERQLEHCDKAIELYDKLLTFNLPTANKEAVEQKLAECQATVGQEKRVAPPVEPAPVEPASEPRPPVEDPAAPRATDTQPAGRAWYKDPVGLALLGSGLIAGGVGTGFWRSAVSLGRDSEAARQHQDALDLKDKANQRGAIGAISMGVGGALVVGGVVWIVTHRDPTEQRAITGWVSSGGGGLAITGPF
jgi:tetratricopeptide (TPR) repeat protein